MLRNIRKLFSKRKTADSSKKDSLENTDKNPIDDIALNQQGIISSEEEAAITQQDEEQKQEIIRTRLNAYVIKNDEEDFRMIDYDMNSGEVLWIEGKLFNNLRGLDRVRWSPSAGSATVFYGYISEEEDGDKLVSSVYIINAIKKLIKKDNLASVVYNMNKKTINIKVKDEFMDKERTIFTYSVCGVVEMERELAKLDIKLVKNKF